MNVTCHRRKTIAFAALLAAAVAIGPVRAAVVSVRIPAGPRPAGRAAGQEGDGGVAAGSSEVAGTKGMKLIASREGLGVVRFDLSALPARAEIHRADLLVRRNQPIHGEDDAALVDIAIYPLFEPFAGGRSLRPEGKPLSLRPPWFDRFDATEAVRAWSAGKPNGGFFVKQFPYWDKAATRLEVVYEGTPGKLPQQVTALKALHRSGQTFLTWKEIAEPVGEDEPTWGRLRQVLAGLDAEREVRYCVYRSRRPIAPETLAQAERIADVRPLSCWNVNGRNLEKPIDDLLANQYALDHHQWNPFVGARVDGRYGVDCRMERLVVRDGGEPLDRGTGLYVHTGREKGRFYYAVVTSVDGVQNTTSFSPANSLRSPVDETPAEPEPVPQKQMPPSPYWDYRETRYHYVRWVAPPQANLPCRYYNWSVAVPKEPGKRMPVELSLHRDERSYYKTQYRIETDSIVVSPHDFPLKTWWYGYHEAQGTLKSFRQGLIHPYTERRVLWFLDWVLKKWPAADANRVLVTGVRGAPATGALHLALRHPERFNMAVVGYGFADYRSAIRHLPETRNRRYVPDVQKLWGKLEWDLKTDRGTDPPRSVWDELDCTRMLRELPAGKELPLVTMTGRGVYRPSRDFYVAMLDGGHAIMANFGTWGGGRLLPISVTGNWSGRMVYQEVRRDLSLPAFKGPGTAILYQPPRQGRYVGAFNYTFRWDTNDLIDRPDRYEITLSGGSGRGATDVTLRRLQRFRVAAGKTYSWEWKPAKQARRAEPANGEVTVGDGGLLTVRGVAIPREGGRLVVAPK